MLDVHDWIELIQLLLYPALKDTINSVMSIQYYWMIVLINSRIVTNPRGNKLNKNEAISIIIDVYLIGVYDKQLLKEVFLNRLRDIVDDPSFCSLWISACYVIVTDTQYCCLVELIHVISQPDSSIREMNTITMITMINTLSSLQCFSVMLLTVDESR